MINEKDDDEEDVTEEELDEDTLAKLDAIAHPDKFTSEPGEMEPEEQGDE